MKKAVFAGTFDPITIGHEAVLKKAAAAFDKLTVAICINPEKTAFFSLEDRIAALRAVCSDYDNVEVVYHEGMLVDLMREKGAKYNVRGVRNVVDYEYETLMHEFNVKLYPELVTLFIPCDNSLTDVSSTAVREKIKKGEDVTCLVPEKALKVIIKN